MVGILLHTQKLLYLDIFILILQVRFKSIGYTLSNGKYDQNATEVGTILVMQHNDLHYGGQLRSNYII